MFQQQNQSIVSRCCEIINGGQPQEYLRYSKLEKMKGYLTHNIQKLLLILVVLLISCIVRCWNITQSFWWDEIWSTMTYVKANSLWQIVSSLGYYFNNHILYSLLARGSITILGESEFAARLPALIMGLFAVILVFLFGKQFLGERTGVLASILLALSAFHIDHSTEARGYSGLALFSILSSFYFLKGMMADERRDWIGYVLFTVLGFYSHVFMIAVSVSQFCTFLLFIVNEKVIAGRTGVSLKGFRNFLLALFSTGTITLLIYAPILQAFFTNMGKVRLVSVNRIPFILSLLESFFPGMQNATGSIFYGSMFCAGVYYIFRKNVFLCLYLLTLFILPITLYLLLNPMFVFERYFIFALPFVLLIVSQGVAGLANKLRGIFAWGFFCICLAAMTYMYIPALSNVLSQDRQNYREAVRYVESEITEGKDDMVFSIGYAGEHFRYYSTGIPIESLENHDELSAVLQGKKRIWCLVTAWLPDIRPPYEDEALYSERTGQTELYKYVKKYFTLHKVFPSRYPVAVYLLTMDKGGLSGHGNE